MPGGKYKKGLWCKKDFLLDEKTSNMLYGLMERYKTKNESELIRQSIRFCYLHNKEGLRL